MTHGIFTCEEFVLGHSEGANSLELSSCEFSWEWETRAMGNLNLIVKVKDTTESEVRKALKAAGIEVRSIVTVYKEEDEKLEEKDEGK